MSGDGLIGLDWGTSSLRAYRFARDGSVREQRVRPWGVRRLPDGGFATALADIIDGWPALPMLAAGMVGSRQGWHEAPYVDTPAGLADVAAALVRPPVAEARGLAIVPGVRHRTPDLMRGEETQVFGACAGRPERALFVLPGTHSKWVVVENARIVRFTTMMTGELFALLRRHSILAAGITSEAPDAEAFDRGVRAALDSGSAGALSRLFGARALMLDGQLPAASVPDYLSGLLIGEEWRAGRDAGWLDDGLPTYLVGERALCDRYRRAATLIDRPVNGTIDDASPRGLWQIARAAARTGSMPAVAGEPT